MPNTIINDATLTYVHVAEPYAYVEGQPAKYSLSALIDKADIATLEKITEGIKAAEERGKAKYGPRFTNVRNPLNDGDIQKPRDLTYKGKYYLNAKTTRPPMCVDGDLNRIDPDHFYSGCVANVSVNFYPYCAAGNCGVAVQLCNIQFVKDGERLDYIVAPENEFKKLNNTDENDDDAFLY